MFSEVYFILVSSQSSVSDVLQVNLNPAGPIRLSSPLMRPTDQQGAVSDRGAVLPLQELVEECGEASNDGGEAALRQHQQQDERTQQEAEKHPGKH